MEIIEVENRKIAVSGIGKLYFEDGLPISISISELKKKGVEVSYLHLIDEFWNNGWEWKTIEMHLRNEIADDVDKSMNIDMECLKKFYDCLEQPKRKNGGYEESREMIFNYLWKNKESATNFLKESIWTNSLK